MKRILITICILVLSFDGFSQQDSSEKRLNIKVFNPESMPVSPRPVNPNCKCEKNILKDGGFTTVIAPGSNISNSSPIWKPDIYSPQYGKQDGCCEAGVVQMWGNKFFGETVRQNGINIVMGKKYRITFCARYMKISGDANPLVRFRFRSFNGTGNNPDLFLPNHIIGTSADISNTSWNTYTLADWTADANYNSININVENNSTQHNSQLISWGQIDNVCIEEVPCDCSKWSVTEFNAKDFKKKVQCGQTIVVKTGEVVSVNPSYTCIGGCKSKVSGTITSSFQPTINITSFPVSFLPTISGTYSLKLDVQCGDKKCRSCTITIIASPACPGEVLGSVQTEN